MAVSKLKDRTHPRHHTGSPSTKLVEEKEEED
jgi:hypothetical protein